MKFIKSYHSFRYSRLDESILYGFSTVKAIIQPQMDKSLKLFSDDKITVDGVLKWVKSTILNPKNPLFLVSPPLEELKATGGNGGSILPKGYHGVVSTVEPDKGDYSDLNYYKFMQIIFSPQTGILSDPNDIKNAGQVDNFTGQKIEAKNCGMYLIEQSCLKKFEGNAMPFAIIKYCIKRVRSEVAKQIKFIDNEKSRNGLDIITFDDVKKNQSTKGGTQSDTGEESSKTPQGFFVNEGPTNHIPELKQILLKVGFRDKGDLQKKNPAETNKQVAVKKREAFYKYFKENIYPKFEKVINEITEKQVEDYLKSIKINPDSGKQSFNEGDIVVYLRKDKTRKDWNNLDDYQKVNYKDEKTIKIIGQGKIAEVLEDDSYKIEYEPQKFTTKNSNEILRKIEKPKEEEEEEDKEQVEKEK